MMIKHIISLIMFVLYYNIVSCQSKETDGQTLDERAMLTNKDATVQAVTLYNYLLDLGQSDSKINKLVSGQWIGASYGPGKSEHIFNLGEVTEIRRQSGKWIGMIDGWICPGGFGDSMENDPIEDCMWYDQMIADYQLWWNNGGICHVDASFFAPLAGEYWLRYEKTVTKEVNNSNVITGGTEENRRWIQMCDRMSIFFLALQEKGIPVIFRPFTESYINIYWYSDKRLGKENFISLYRQLYDYLTIVKGCNNIIWEFQGERSFPNYPGDEYVDIITAKSDYVSWASCCNQCISSSGGKPIGNAELGDYGENFRVEKSKQHKWNDWVETTKEICPRMTFYTVWDRRLGPVKNPDSNGNYTEYDMEYNMVMLNPYVITRDEINFTPKGASLPYENEFDNVTEKPVTFGGDWNISAGKIRREDKAQGSRVFFGNTDWQNYQVQTQLNYTVNDKCALIGRCTSSTIFYQAQVGDGYLTIQKCFNGAFKDLKKISFMPKNGENMTLNIGFQGDIITAWADCKSTGIASVSASDISIPVGCVGFSAIGTVSPEFEFIRVLNTK